MVDMDMNMCMYKVRMAQVHTICAKPKVRARSGHQAEASVAPAPDLGRRRGGRLRHGHGLDGLHHHRLRLELEYLLDLLEGRVGHELAQLLHVAAVQHRADALRVVRRLEDARA